MSLQTLGDGLVGRLSHRRAAVAVAGVSQPRPEALPEALEALPEALGTRMSGSSMRFLEAGLAMTAILTALLIGLGR